MNFALRLLLCVFLALDISPNEARRKNPILRSGYDNGEVWENLSDEEKIWNNNLVETNGRRYIEKDKKPILRAGLQNEKYLEILPVYQVVDNSNDVEHSNGYEDPQRDDSYEKRNGIRIGDEDDSRIEDENNIEADKDNGVDYLLELVLSNGNSKKYHSSESSQREISLETFQDKNSNTYDKLLTYVRDDMLRKKSGIWKTCGKKAAKYCKKACEDVVNTNCYGSDCKKSVKKRLKKECKSSCKDRFQDY